MTAYHARVLTGSTWTMIGVYRTAAEARAEGDQYGETVSVQATQIPEGYTPYMGKLWRDTALAALIEQYHPTH